MKNSAAGLVVLLLNGAIAEGRDPFAPPPGAGRCATQAATDFSWHLLGVVGRKGRYIAWLRSPQGKVVSSGVDEILPHSPWRVIYIDRTVITLQAEDACQTPLTLRLKGAKDA